MLRGELHAILNQMWNHHGSDFVQQWKGSPSQENTMRKTRHGYFQLLCIFTCVNGSV